MSPRQLAQWDHIESYHSAMGMVETTLSGMWQGKVSLGGRFYRLSEQHESAQAAMSAVERTWKREQQNQAEKGKAK